MGGSPTCSFRSRVLTAGNFRRDFTVEPIGGGFAIRPPIGATRRTAGVRPACGAIGSAGSRATGIEAMLSGSGTQDELLFERGPQRGSVLGVAPAAIRERDQRAMHGLR